jgi:hypothetical protein
MRIEVYSAKNITMAAVLIISCINNIFRKLAMEIFIEIEFPDLRDLIDIHEYAAEDLEVLAQSEQRVLHLLVQMWHSIYNIQGMLMESNAFCADQVLGNELAGNLCEKVFRKFVKGTNFWEYSDVDKMIKELIIKCSHVLFVTACILMTGRVVLKQRPAYSDFWKVMQTQLLTFDLRDQNVFLLYNLIRELEYYYERV